MKIGPHIEVTDEMLDAGADLMPTMMWNRFELAQAYRAMRALEPGQHQSIEPREIKPASMAVRRV